MKRLITIVILMLLAVDSAMARWAVSHVTVNNITNQLASLSVQSTQQEDRVCFNIRVTETDRMWFRSKFAATLQAPHQPRKSIEPIAVMTNGRRTVAYDITLQNEEITDDAAFLFWIHPDPEDSMAFLGGFYYHFELKSFAENTGTSNNRPELTGAPLRGSPDAQP